MPSEQKQLFLDENQATLKKDYDVENDIVDTIRSVIKPEILESSFHYKLKNVKIDLPKINIPNEVLLKHEVDKYRKLFQHKPQTARKSINMKTGSCTEECTLLHKSEKVEETGIKMSAKVLSFNCLKCQDSTRYSPNDLQKHFQMWHKGELPSYPCEMCNFSASDFQLFKLHRRNHKGTSVKCDICNDEKIYTLLDLTKHFISTHCVNGSFQCEKCTFSTLDVGTFVQHIHRHNDVHYKSDKYHHTYLSRGEIQKHLNNVHSVTFPFNCKYCRFGTSKREYLVRHVLTLHKEHLYAKEKLEKDKYEKRMAQTSVGLKLILKRYKIGTSRKIFWKRKKINNESDQSIEQNTEGLKNMNKTQANSEDQSHLTQEHLNEEKDERLHCENNDKTAESESEKPPLLSTGQYNKAGELSNIISGSLKTAVQGPTVVTVKNNRITVPANYSAKFMGFKMVDGKQHIVIKLLPTIKPNLCSPGSQSDATKDSTANLQLPSLNTTGFVTRVKTEVSDTVYMKAPTFSCSSPIPAGKVTSEKEIAVLSQTSNTLQTVDDEKSVSSLPTSSELVTSSVNLTPKVETRDDVNLLGSHITHSLPKVSDTASPDKVNSTTKPNAYNSGDMHNYCINYVNSELPVESFNQGSLPFHNYSKVNNFKKRRRSLGIAMCESPQRESSSSKTIGQQPVSESVSSLVKKESSNSDSMLTNLLNTKDETLKTQAEIEEQYVLEEEQDLDEQSLYINENQHLESMTEKSNDDISVVESPGMPRITSVFSLQSEQASEFLPPEVNQLLQDELKSKSDVKQDSSNTPDKVLSLDCDQSFQKHEGEGKIIESSKDFKVQGIFPIPSYSMGINVPPNYLNLKCHGNETQMLSVSQDVRDSEKTPKISGICTLLKTQSDAIITQQLVKDKLRATTQNLGSSHTQSPLVNSEPKKAVFVQTAKGFFVPLHIANKPGLHVVSGKPQVNMQGVPATLLLNKKPGMILTLNNGKFEGVNTVKSESAQTCGPIAKEPCRTPFLKVEPNNNCLTPTLCSSIGSCLSTKSSSENTLPLKGPYIIKTPASSSGKPVPPPNIIISEHPSTKSNILDPAKKQNEIFPKPPLFTLLPDGKQAVFLKCVLPNKTELLKPKFVQNSTYYQNIQPKNPEGTPQKILLKIFNPVLNVTAANNMSVSNSVFSSQKDSVSSNQTARGEQKEPDSSRDALPFLLDDMMPANEIVVTSATSESSEEAVHASDRSEARILRCKTNCTFGRSFNKQKTSPHNFSRIKTHVRSKDSETGSVSRNRNCKRKCRDSYQEPPRKTTLHRKCKGKVKPEDVHESFGFSRTRLSKDSVRTLRLFPFSSKQLVKCPRRNQPVVVLNHPDADAPEVVNVMKTISKFNGHVLKVSLSERTLSALLKPVCYSKSFKTTCDFSKRHKTLKPISSVKERFVLKLTLKKTSKNNYRIVKTTSENVLKATFNCWFCGRVFDNQDAWAGHGQRHLMEATRDWNMLE